jgi:hypothetical protein
VSACAADNTYDQIILADQPVGFWDFSAMDTNEPDLTGNGNSGTYINGLQETEEIFFTAEKLFEEKLHFDREVIHQIAEVVHGL